MRNSTINRKTGETDIKLNLTLDVCEKGVIKTGCGFLDHMLELFSKHGRFTLSVLCQHGQRSLAGYSAWGLKELDTTE